MSDVAGVRVCAEGDIPSRGVRVVAIGGVKVAVFRAEDGGLFAIEDRCPHRGAPLSSGLVYDNNKVACGDHGWSICLSDGKVDPPECGQVKTFPVNVEDGMVRVWIEGRGEESGVTREE